MAGAGCARNEQTSNTSALGQTGVADEKQENTAPAGEKKEESSDFSVKAPSLTIDVPGVTVVTEQVKKSEDEDKKPATAQGATITYDDNGFSPSTLTVKVGTKVTFKNNSPSDFWPASAMHPTHQLLPGFDQLKSVGAAGTYEYTFVKVGTWKYHNHVVASDSGTVVVTE